MKKGLLLTLAATALFACSKNVAPADPEEPVTKAGYFSAYLIGSNAAPFYGGRVEFGFEGVNDAYTEVRLDTSVRGHFIFDPVPYYPKRLILQNAYWDRGR